MTDKLPYYLIKKFNDLGFDYDRLSSSGKETYDDIAVYINNRVPHYLMTHSDFDNGFMFEFLLECLKNEGFQDISYKNDTSPSIGCSPDSQWNDFVQIFVDYKDQEKSEHGDCYPSKYYRYNVLLKLNQDEVKSYATNNEYEAIYYAWELRNELSPYKTEWINRRRMELRNYEGEWVDCYVLETEADDTDPEEFLENTLHIEVLENGHLQMMLDRSVYTFENTPENLEHLTRMLLGFAITEGYYDGFPIVKDANND